MYNFKIQELCDQDFNQESIHFRTLVKYCREMFHCSIEEIVSLVGKMLAGENGQVKAHVIYADCSLSPLPAESGVFPEYYRGDPAGNE